MLDEGVGTREDGRSFRIVVQDILGNVEHLVRAELRLAKTEVRGEIRAATLVIAGAAIANLALAFLLLCAFSLLEETLSPWLAALIVAAAAAAMASMVTLIGLKRMGRTQAQQGHTVRLARGVDSTRLESTV